MPYLLVPAGPCAMHKHKAGSITSDWIWFQSRPRQNLSKQPVLKLSAGFKAGWVGNWSVTYTSIT